MENQPIYDLFKDMEKKDIPDFFEALKSLYGPSVYFPLFKTTLENKFDSIPKCGFAFVLMTCEEAYKNSVSLDKIRREGMKAEKELRKTNALLVASAYNLAKESELFTKAASDLAEKVPGTKGVIKKGIADITGIYSEEILKKAKPRNKLPA